MGQIPVQQLAKMMGIAEQDLIFKLKSIGVRVDEKDPQIDTEVMQAILQGKRLTQPREVILRDAEEQKNAPPPPPQRRVPTRRPTGSRTAISCASYWASRCPASRARTSIG